MVVVAVIFAIIIPIIISVKITHSFDVWSSIFLAIFLSLALILGLNYISILKWNMMSDYITPNNVSGYIVTLAANLAITFYIFMPLLSVLINKFHSGNISIRKFVIYLIIVLILLVTANIFI